MYIIDIHENSMTDEIFENLLKKRLHLHHGTPVWPHGVASAVRVDLRLQVPFRSSGEFIQT